MQKQRQVGFIELKQLSDRYVLASLAFLTTEGLWNFLLNAPKLNFCVAICEIARYLCKQSCPFILAHYLINCHVLRCMLIFPETLSETLINMAGPSQMLFRLEII